MRGYHDESYGDGFADVYDDWYADISDVEATSAVLAELAAAAGGHRVLELGVGTGRLAIPLAARGLDVVGVDSSAAMLERLRAKPEAAALMEGSRASTSTSDAGEPVPGRLDTVQGDMVDGLPDGPFHLVFVAYNTFFSLLTEERQRACFRSVAERLVPGGWFVVEAFVPDTEHDAGGSVTVRSVHADRVVLSVSTADPGHQRAEGQYIDITEAGGVRLRPWSIRWATPAQLDGMAGVAGLALAERWTAFDRSAFGPDSGRHVSVYRRPG